MPQLQAPNVHDPLDLPDIEKVCRILEVTYGSPRLGNPIDPLDDLIYILLSNKTTPSMAQDTYEALKTEYPKWDDLLDDEPGRLESFLQPSGLSTLRAGFIRGALRKIKATFDLCDLSGLSKLSEEEAILFLESLPGVSVKVARCVAMFTLGAKVLPVDVHVHRLATRLGLVNRRRPEQCQKSLDLLIRPELRYSFHVNAIAHGRTVCRAVKPKCDSCCIKALCRTAAA